MSQKYTLEILPENEDVRNFYLARLNFDDDAGVDLFTPQNIVIKPQTVEKLDLKIKCRMVDSNGNTVSYFMYPRSSIANTNLMLANSVGIIDKGYRGSIKAALRNLSLTTNEEILAGSRMVQITAPDLSPLKIKLVESLDETIRGEGGFGSTSK